MIINESSNLVKGISQGDFGKVAYNAGLLSLYSSAVKIDGLKEGASFSDPLSELREIPVIASLGQSH